MTPYNGSTVPSFWKSLKKLKDEPERVDFTLNAENQDRYTMLFMGDIHLYSHKSINCFNSTFIPEINSYISSSASCPVYASTLGDMTWDWYWYNGDKIGIEQYIPNINNIRGLQIYNTVGNHDNDMQHDSLSEFQRTGADWTCMTQYRKKQGPTCFSYNIGGIHYVSLDNVITTNTGGTTDKDSRGCWRGVTESDMRWLEQDLSYVSEDAPVVGSVHMPLFNMKGKPTAGNSKSINYTVQDITAPFRKFGKVLFISAHTHLLYNTEDYDVSGLKVTEWNSGALCGNFWTTAVKTGLNLCVGPSADVTDNSLLCGDFTAGDHLVELHTCSDTCKISALVDGSESVVVVGNTGSVSLGTGSMAELNIGEFLRSLQHVGLVAEGVSEDVGAAFVNQLGGSVVAGLGLGDVDLDLVLNAQSGAVLYRIADIGNKVKIKTGLLFSGKCFSA